MKSKFLCYSKFTVAGFTKIIYRDTLTLLNQVTATNSATVLSKEDFVTYLKTAINNSAMFPRTEAYEIKETTATTLTTVINGAVASLVTGGKNRVKVAFSYDTEAQEYSFTITVTIENIKTVTVVPVEFAEAV